MRPTQLPLGVQLRAAADFATYLPGPNAAALAAAQATAADACGQIYLWGGHGVGKSHLLQAACRAAAGGNRPVAYLPLADLTGQPPDLLDGFGGMVLVCLDDVQAIVGRSDWEQSLVGALDHWRAAGCRVAVAGPRPPAGLTGMLPDLASRLGWGSVYALRELDEDGKRALLSQRAAARGLHLPATVGRYLLTRRDRDLPSLIAMLEHLDLASLAAQRRLTIPFVKQVLGS